MTSQTSPDPLYWAWWKVLPRGFRYLSMLQSFGRWEVPCKFFFGKECKNDEKHEHEHEWRIHGGYDGFHPFNGRRCVQGAVVQCCNLRKIIICNMQMTILVAQVPSSWTWAWHGMFFTITHNERLKEQLHIQTDSGILGYENVKRWRSESSHLIMAVSYTHLTLPTKA